MSKFADLSALNKEIAAIKVAGAKLDDRIQNAGVAVLEHFAVNKDTGLVNRLYDALPRGARKTAFVSWLLAHCAVIANADPKTKEAQPFVYAKDKTTNAEAAAADPWYNHKPDPKPDDVFDLQKAVKALLARAAKAKTIKGGTLESLKALAVAGGLSEADAPSKLAE